MQKIIVFSFLLFFITACSGDEQSGTPSESVATGAAQTTVSITAPPAAKQQEAAFNLVFFLDPGGRPCQMQNSILKNMAGELQGKVTIKYVQTTVPADREIFYKYGIRSLPTLLLADANGREIKRMPPGVKQSSDIRLLLQSIPQS
jgi:thioredoxin